jgi:hypothetical protein
MCRGERADGKFPGEPRATESMIERERVREREREREREGECERASETGREGERQGCATRDRSR